MRHLKAPRENGQSALRLMDINCRIKKIDAMKFDWRVCVLRDPLERAASIYSNKFIQKSGNADIFDNFYKLTNKSPEEASFEFFVKEYLSCNQEGIDPHCYTQISHLLPITYNCAMMMENIHNDMMTIIGKNESDIVFRDRKNATSHKNNYADPCSAINAEKLSERYEADGRLPSYAALYTDDLKDIILNLYAPDLNLIKCIKEQNDSEKYRR
jgi:hypothetical protein